MKAEESESVPSVSFDIEEKKKSQTRTLKTEGCSTPSEFPAPPAVFAD
jgi:hypothetical protein